MFKALFKTAEKVSVFSERNFFFNIKIRNILITDYIKGTNDYFFAVHRLCNEVKNGDLVAVDGFKGNVIVSPSNDDIKEFENKQEAYLKDKESLKQYFGKPTVTKSGIKKLLCRPSPLQRWNMPHTVLPRLARFGGP